MSADTFADSLRTPMPGQHTTPHPSVLFRLVGSQHDGQLLRIRKEKFTVGSSLGCTLALRSPHVHPLHGMFLRGERGLLFRAMASDTRVNGESITDCWLSPGDRLSMGSIDLEILENGTLVNEPDSSVCETSPTTQATQTQDSPANSDTPYDIRLHEHLRVRKLLAELRSTRELLHQALQTETLSAGDTCEGPISEAVECAVEFDATSDGHPCAKPDGSRDEPSDDSDAFHAACETVGVIRPIENADHQTQNTCEEIENDEYPASPPEIEPTSLSHSPQTDEPSSQSTTLAPNTGFSEDSNATPPGESTPCCDSAVEPEAYSIDAYLNERVQQRSSSATNSKAASMEIANSEDNEIVVAKTEALLKSAFEDQLHSLEDESSSYSTLPFDPLASAQELSSLREAANLSARESIKERVRKQASMLGLIAIGGTSTAIGATLGITSTSLVGSVAFVGLGVALLAAAVATQASRMTRTA